MTKGLFAWLVAGTLTVPQVSSALAIESAVGLGGPRQAQRDAAPLPLPPIPYLETMPWLTSGAAAKGPKVDVLLRHNPEALGPALAQPGTPAWDFYRATTVASAR